MSTANAGRIEVSLVLDGGEAFVVDVKQAGKSLDNFSKRAANAAKHTETWTHKLRDTAIILGLARNALANLNDLILGMPRAIIQQNALLERQQFLIAGMNTEATSYAEAQKQANEQMEELINISSRSPYALQAVADSFAKLNAGGIQETQQSLESLIGASAKMGATSEAFKRASIAIQQMAGKGVISMEELRQQLGEAIPNVMPMMADAVGMEMGRMVKLISSGAMEAQTALENLFNEMYWTSLGAAELMAQTWEGTMNRINNSLTVLAKEIGDAGFMDAVKGAANDFNTLLESPEAKSLARDIGEALTSATHAATELAKVLNDNLKILSAIAGFFVANSLISAGLGKLFDAYRSVKSFNEGFVQTNRQAQKKISDDIAREMEKRELATRAAAERTQRYVRAGQLRSYQQIRHFQQAQTAIVMHQTGERIKAFDAANAKIERRRTSMMARGKAAVSGMVDAIGGWTTVMIAGISAVIYALDELIWKQERAAESLVRNSGMYSTADQLDLADKELARKRQQIIDAEAQAEKFEAKGDRVGRDDVSYATLAAQQRRVAERLREEIETLEAGIQLGEKYLSNFAAEQGKGMFRSMEASRLAEISSALEKAQKEARAEVEAMVENGEIDPEQFEAELKTRLVELRKESYQALNELAQEFITDQQTLLKALDGDNSRSAEELRKKIKSAIDATEKQVEAAAGKIEIVDQKLLQMNGNSLSAADKTMASFERQIAILQSRNKHLQQGVELEDKIAALEADIASGKYKNAKPKDVAEMKRLVKILQEVFNLNKQLTKEVRDRNKAINRLNQLAIKAKSNLGTAKAKSDNPFLKWQEGLSRTMEQLDEIKIQIGDVSKLTEEQQKAIADDEARLRSVALQAAALNAHNQQRERQIELTDSLADEYERYLRQTQREADYMRENQLALEKKLTEVEKNSDEYKEILRVLELIRININLTAQAAKKINPRTDGWYQLQDSIENMHLQVDNELATAVDGVFDGFAQNMVDTEFSFSKMIQSMSRDLAKFAIKMAMMKAANAAFSHFFGGPSDDVANVQLSPDTAPKSLPVERYAKGGIATSPQIALFGEGSMNEAYVPLPDGRSIPVTMQGGGAAPVVNVINQTGIQADAEPQDIQFDGERYIVDVVMKAAGRPGKFRNSLKGM